ncbi:hypothetical protein DOS84_12200 [Flavobacterium aquariorum]|uniref:Uncharacterized protein n=1 Tax=Flavobacterium aquariorum TaxID=2217670 RepID=A0A2W7U783_9FLAO|nr:hypothetical protein [Flavobacterium aquariorum]PZX93119.1 hypothetical protein DOS84_12200 [Flavobacterium aquariorum]
MKTIFTIALTLFTSFLFADSHIIVKQNGEKLEVNYVTTKNNTVYYSVSGNSTLNEISLFAIEKIIDKKTNSLIIDNHKVDVSGKTGYKKVQFLTKDQTIGLQQGAILKTIIHKPKGFTKSDWIAEALTNIKKQAAKQGFPFVVITKQTDSKIEAMAYTY